MTGQNLHREVFAGLLVWVVLVAVVGGAQGRTAAVVVAGLPALCLAGAVRLGRHTVAGWSALGLGLVLVAGLQLVRENKGTRPVRVEVTACDLPSDLPAARRPVRVIEGRHAIGGVR